MHRSTNKIGKAIVPPTFSWLWALCLAVYCASPTPSGADQAPRWSEAGYGISLTPPPNTLQFENQGVQWVDPRGFSVSFEIARSDLPADLNDRIGATMVQLGFARAKPRLLDAEGQQTEKLPTPQTIADRPGIKFYFQLDETDQAEWFKAEQGLAANGDIERPDEWFCGQAIVMLEPYASAVVKLTSIPDSREAGQQAFEAVLASMNVPLARELDVIRENYVEIADQWLKTTTPQTWAEALPDDQWFRIVDRDKDIGHQRVRTTRDHAALRRFGQEPPGTLVLIERRDYLGERVIDTQSVLFAHDDREREYWENKATLRLTHKPVGLNDRAALQPLTSVQIGIRGTQQVQRRNVNGNPIKRDLNVLTLISEIPPGFKAVQQILAQERFARNEAAANVRGRVDANREWVVPERSYLSQVQVWALGAMLPAESQIYCFTAFHPGSGQPGLRTVRVLPQPDGGLVVLDRPTSGASPTRLFYDADRKLIERVTPQGVRLIPTTRNELAEVWDIKLSP